MEAEAAAVAAVVVEVRDRMALAMSLCRADEVENVYKAQKLII